MYEIRVIDFASFFFSNTSNVAINEIPRAETIFKKNVYEFIATNFDFRQRGKSKQRPS